MFSFEFSHRGHRGHREIIKGQKAKVMKAEGKIDYGLENGSPVSSQVSSTPPIAEPKEKPSRAGGDDAFASIAARLGG